MLGVEAGGPAPDEVDRRGHADQAEDQTDRVVSTNDAYHVEEEQQDTDDEEEEVHGLLCVFRFRAG